MNLPEHAPFEPAQRQALEALLPGLRADQAHWLSAYLAGTQVSLGGAALASASPAAKKPELTILFGTESGNCEVLADKTAKLAKGKGFKPKVRNMSETSAADLAAASNLLVVVSTWGDGDPPDAATTFHADLMSDSGPDLKKVSYSVCALGDTSYEQFCETGKQVDRRLEELGATRIHPRQDCDVDYEEAWQAWVEAAIDALPKPPGSNGEAGSVSVAVPSDAVAAPISYGKKHPWQAEILEKINLNGSGSQKETWHLELSLEDSGLSYEPGDALAVIPENRTEDVEDLIIAGKLDGGIADDLRTQFDITTLSARFVGKYNALAKSDKLSRLLEAENKKELQQWLQGRQIIDLLQEYPMEGLDADTFCGLLRKLQPRLYSIASSLKAHADEVHLTVAAVRYQTHGRDRVGVASTYLADRVSTGQTVPVYFHANKNFRLPADPDTPIIMIGPGTGIAPFRAFVEERVATGAAGKNWLFFGDQHYMFDFLYQLEWQEYFAAGQLHKLHTAFSRDQKHKIYVQDRMREEASTLYGWLEEGAHLYVCGDASRMAKDVHQALIEIVGEQGGKSDKEAEAYVDALRKAKRYQRDVY